MWRRSLSNGYRMEIKESIQATRSRNDIQKQGRCYGMVQNRNT